jgi:hypothetical protein
MEQHSELMRVFAELMEKRKAELPVIGVLEAQLDHVIEGQGMLKSLVETQRLETKGERETLRNCITEAKQEMSASKQWRQDFAEEVLPAIHDSIKELQDRTDKLWKAQRILPVFDGVLILVATLLAKLGLELPFNQGGSP